MICGSTECPKYYECKRSMVNGGMSNDRSIANLASYGSAIVSSCVNEFHFVCGSLGRYQMFVQKSLYTEEKPIK